jgi:RNA polymerase sigma-70 factor (ECF subfamily)
MIGDAARAEDIAQDAFVKGYLSLRDFRGESRFSTWVCRIAINRCRDLLRRARREVLMPDGDPPLSESVDAGETPAAALERREREEVLRRALARLPLKYREAVVLRHIEGMEFREVGRLLGIAAGAAKVRTFRGREMLRRFLEREGFRDEAI